MKKIISHMGLLHALTNAEHYDTHDAIIQYGNDKYMLIPGLTPLWSTYVANFQVEIDEFKVSRKLPITKEIQEMDAARDESFRDINRTVEYYTYNKVERKKEAAILLKNKLLDYKGSNTESYTKNSAAISKLIIDLKKEPYLEATQVLGLEAELNLLNVQNKSFMSLYRTRAHEIRVMRRHKLINAQRKSDSSFSAVADLLMVVHQNALLVSPDLELLTITEDFIDTVNSYLRTAADNLTRHSSYKKPKDENTPSDQPALDPPHFIIVEQVAYEEETLGGLKMSLRAQDPVRFSRVLYPAALGGVLQMINKRDEVLDFPIIGFMMSDDAQNPSRIGLIISPFKSTAYFVIPFEGEREGPAKIIKDNEVIAILDGTSCPICTTLD
ncbi:hypothetical protein M2459_001695 [Parabacteroides sp. PF5-5]|uniref:DUF6261 family protein n=1 Tax=unclassified Parabacteroides TaxID=2649774 RepID=UPI0024769B7D|nr:MULTISPECIES: DUF6261 family protein [unclassified Parabacteroides]MDH6304958.1 hypothetical protein [Parabacteroides sp. PH5-39]MDH6315956.1 hypothetical protein [Parabacteroides sp. PF5-13]MDH6319613.1 hypothetical protein [Parabacteroides sp. PH5-13]MDH6323344.1 hypothetical protein [Parabacteroides sp. PH5-8]MDH6327147.1 hypothetical protein [Parabacteroides sp. PH5-41]